jgi:predicted metal-dependent enzyme (double-stranded beta helix superfamily)
VEKALEGWIDEKILASDSTIALSWTMAEMKPLAMYHKNRVIQIRRGTKLDQLYHVRTEVNSADVGTRPDKLKIQDMGPGSVWQVNEDGRGRSCGEQVHQANLPAQDER